MTTWRLRIGDITSPTDFSDWTAGCSVSQPIELLRPSTHSATFTLHNVDGALTPAAAGGTGTYKDFDWFASGVWLEADATGSGYVTVFAGIVDDFEIDDDGVKSMVTLTAVDGCTIAGRAPADWSSFVFSEASAADTIISVLSELYGFQVVPLPRLGNSDSDVSGTALSSGGVLLRGTASQTGQTIADVLTTNIMSSTLAASWPTVIVDASGTTTYGFQTISDNMLRVDAGAHQFTLIDAKTAGASSDFRFSDLQVGYESRHLANWAIMTSLISTNEIEALNSSSIETYGAQQYQATSTTCRYDDDTLTPLGIRAGMRTAAGNIVNRLGDVRLSPLSVRIVGGQADAVDDTEIELLLDVTTGFWQLVELTRTPTGASSSLTDHHLIVGRRLEVLPDRWSITLDLVPAVQYAPFVLNSADFGVLDSNRLGIDTYI